MKRYLLLHYGFEQPTPEIMAAWEKWFKSISENAVDHGGFTMGREISSNGKIDLPWDKESITGFNIIQAEDFDAAEKIAQENPYISSIRIYEIRAE